MKRAGLGLVVFGVTFAVIAAVGCRAIVGIVDIESFEGGMGMNPAPGDDAGALDADNPTNDDPDAAYCVAVANSVGHDQRNNCASCCGTQYTPSYNELIINAQPSNANCLCNALDASTDPIAPNCIPLLCGVDGGAALCSVSQEQGAFDAAAGGDASILQGGCPFCTERALIVIAGDYKGTCARPTELETCTGLNGHGICATEAFDCLQTCIKAFK